METLEATQTVEQRVATYALKQEERAPIKIVIAHEKVLLKRRQQERNRIRAKAEEKGRLASSCPM